MQVRDTPLRVNERGATVTLSVGAGGSGIYYGPSESSVKTNTAAPGAQVTITSPMYVQSQGLRDGPPADLDVLGEDTASASSGSSAVAGYDGLYVDETTGVTYRRADDGTMTAIAVQPQSVPASALTDTARGTGWLPDDVIDDTFSLDTPTIATVSLVSGRMRLSGQPVIPGGRTCNGITVLSGATPASGLTHLWFAIYDLSLNLLGQTADQGAATWAATAIKRLNLVTPYTPAQDTPVYVGVMAAGTTPPTLTGNTAVYQGTELTPSPAGFPATTGLTTTAPNPSASLGGGGALFYARLHE